MNWPVVTPHPVPLGDISSWPRSAGLFDITDNIFQRVVFFLDRVPVVPNANGLYDQNGNWLEPVVSVLDFLVISALIVSFFVIFSRLAGNPGSIYWGSALRGVKDVKEPKYQNNRDRIYGKRVGDRGRLSNGKPW